MRIMSKGKDYLGLERRKYIRLDSVFPVEFRLLSLDEKNFLSDWLLGFTNNIGKGGICLEVSNLPSGLIQILKSQQAKIYLNIKMPFAISPVSAKASLAWMKDVIGQTNRYLMGLNYEQVDVPQNNRIMRYARMKKLFIPVVLSIIIILGLGFMISSFINVKLIRGNKALVEQLVKILQESSVAKQKIKQISRQRQDLELKIEALKTRIQAMEEEKMRLTEKTRSRGARNTAKLERLNTAVDKLIQEKSSLQEELIALQYKENNVTEELLLLDKKKVNLEKANLDKMYQWLKARQNPRTGLVVSFEGGRDIDNRAFTYDQALAMQVYNYFGDFERTRKTLDFFYKRAERQDGIFFNAYYVHKGNPAEHIVHSGSNIWLGIAVIQYTQKTQDRRFLRLAEEIAQAIIHLWDKDAGSSMEGGLDVAGYATEYNLDAYALFDLLYKVTGKQQYIQARDKALGWLVKHTSTSAWAIAALGPEKLEELGMNPDRIMEFSEEIGSVKTSPTQPETQTIKIKRTAQMVLAFKIMADFYYQKNMVAKARTCELKADTYLAELANMVISPSVSGTAYALFAYYKYNPLMLEQ